MTTLILGNITLLEDRAIVHEIRAILQCDSVNQAEALGEKLIYVYNAYLIPEAYKFPIKWECKKELSFAGPVSRPTVAIGDTLHTIADIREMISDLDDNDQVCMETIDMETGDVSDLFPFYIDVIDGIKLTDETTVREVRFCQQKQSAWEKSIHKSPEPTEVRDIE